MRSILSLMLAAVVLHLVLIQPNHPAAMTPGALLLFPLELPVILLGMIALRPGTVVARAVRMVLVAALMLLVVQKSADLGTFTAFNRAFNPVIDLHLVSAAWNLGSGAIGTAMAALVVAGGLLALIALGLALWWALGRWQRVAPTGGWQAGTGAAAALAAAVAVAEIGQAMRAWALPASPPGAAFTARVAVERIGTYRTALMELAAFRRAAESDPFDGQPGLMAALDGRDVLIIYVESYGRASFDNPLYAPTHTATLRAAEAEIGEAGLAMRSGWMTAPMSGGQSWLAHGTVASGLTTSDQVRYAAMLGSARRTIFHLAAQAGYRTAAVMPAITMPWPEADLLGFDTVLAAADLGYRGQPFNWVTMPDQFTLARYAELLPASEAPLFAQIALISSHAPWVPVPEMVDWDAVGDGTIFDQWALSGDPPDVVWRDRDRVRNQYRQSVNYALQAALGYAARRGALDGAEAPLMIILGDHQSAGFIAQSDSLDVPVHLIGPPEVLDLFEGWGWTAGLIPAGDLPAWPMAAFRDAVLRATSPGLSDVSGGGSS
jgi:hypothetical protein